MTDLNDLYDRLIADHDGVERKGKTTPYTSMRGNMFSFVTKEGALALRLSAEERAKFLARYEGAEVVQHGRLMKDYVAVPDAMLAPPKRRTLKKYFGLSVTHAATLKPKATKRR